MLKLCTNRFPRECPSNFWFCVRNMYTELAEKLSINSLLLHIFVWKDFLHPDVYAKQKQKSIRYRTKLPCSCFRHWTRYWTHNSKKKNWHAFNSLKMYGIVHFRINVFDFFQRSKLNVECVQWKIRYIHKIISYLILTKIMVSVPEIARSQNLNTAYIIQ